jgi:hypothetical protein
VRIHDTNFHGGQAYVYRLTLTADPYVDRAYPLGGRRGTSAKFELAGQGLPRGPVEIPLPAAGPADYVHRLTMDGKLTNPFLLELDDLPEHLEAEPNDEPSQVKPIALPAVLNGRIGKPGDVDYWAITAHKGEAIEFDLRASRLGSPLDGVLVLLDASTKELARAEAQAPGADPFLRFTAPADGTYFVRVADRFHSRGGPQFAYRLRVDHPPPPDFRLRLGADVLTLNRGGQVNLRVLAERLGGFPAPITLEIAGLPKGVTASGTTIAAQQPAVDVALKSDPTARIGPAHLTIRGSAKVGDRTVVRTATLPVVRGMPDQDRVLLAVALPTPFKVVGDYDVRWAARGTIHQRHYRIERGGYDGPLEVSLADRQMRHLQGATGSTITVPAGVSEFDYAVQLPPWMETGRTCRVVVQAAGTIKDRDGSEHVVTFSSVQQNEQVVVVVEPGRLAVETDRSTLMAAPGKTVPLRVRVARGKGLTGPVKLEFLVASHIHGLAADPVVVAADRSEARLELRFAAERLGPFNMPAVIRGTITEGGKPIVAETKLEVLPGR